MCIDVNLEVFASANKFGSGEVTACHVRGPVDLDLDRASSADRQSG